jgi:alpha-tubulin suppressor-like RCC1 family protein
MYRKNITKIICFIFSVSILLLGGTNRCLADPSGNANLFGPAVGAKIGITGKGNSGFFISSWNSHDTNNIQDSNGQYNGYHGTNGDLALVSGLVNLQYQNIYGDLYLGPTASVTNNSYGGVTGTMHTNWNGKFPDAQEPTVDTNGNAIYFWPSPTSTGTNGHHTITTIYDFTTSGYYFLDQNYPIMVEQGVNVTIEVRPNTYPPNWIPGNITINGGTTNSGTLIVYQQNGTTDFGALSGAINNRPENFIFFGGPGLSNITFGGNTTFVGAIYAPEAAITLLGGGSGYNVVGSIVGSSIYLNGHYDLHYDTSLAGYFSGIPYILNQPVSTLANPGTTVNFSVSVVSKYPVAYQWYKGNTSLTDGGNVSGSSTATLTLVNVQGRDQGNYSVVITNVNGATTSSVVNLTETLPSFVAQPANQVVPLGSSASVGITATGDNLSYQWFKDRVRLMNQTNSTLNFASFQFTNGGSYSVMVSNFYGMAISLPALLNVPGTPLKTWGGNIFGELGNGTTNNSNVPATIASNVVAAAAGGGDSLFITADGTLWAMGNNSYGQLGDGTTSNSLFPEAVASNVVAVAAGSGHSLFIKIDGTLWAMGDNSFGQLGIGSFGFQTNRPVSVASNVVAVAAGDSHSLFVKADGSLWAMGWNGMGQLGNGTTTGSYLPVAVASNVIAAAAGRGHSIFLKTDGSLWTVGENDFGELGNGTVSSPVTQPMNVASNVVATAAGAFFSLYVKTDGTLWAMGDNRGGELGNGTTNHSALPLNVASNVVEVAASGGDSLFTSADGTLWAMGYNSGGQLGNGSFIDANVPVAVPGLTISSLGTGVSLAVGASSPQCCSLTNTSANFGQPVTFSVVVTNGDGPFSYQWQLNGTNMMNATNASYSIAGAALADAGNYSVTVTGLAGSASQSAALAVNILPAAMALGNVIQTDAGLQLTVQLTGSPNYPYILQMATNLTPPVNWQPVFTNPADANGNWTFTVTNLPDLPAGYYRAVGQ